MLTDEELNTIERRAQAATPGPWYPIATDDEFHQNARFVSLKPYGKQSEGYFDEETGLTRSHGIYNIQHRQKKRLMPGIFEPETVVAVTLLQQPDLASSFDCDENTIFIANSRADVPALVAEVRRLRQLLAMKN